MNLLNNKNVFVSGGAGVIGRPLVKRLHEMGASVLVGDLKSRPQEFSPSIGYRRGDLNYITERELKAFAPNYFFHLAATFERSEETYDFWSENYNHNVRLSNYLMTVLKDIKSLESVSFASSYLIYDPKLYLGSEVPSESICLSESAPINPRNLTGSAKLNHEIELQFLNEFLSERCRFTWARIFRSYGRGSRDIISRWVRALLADEQIDLYNKENRFDYIFADDVAEGLIRLAVNESATGIYNLGTGVSRSVSDVVDVLKGNFPSAVIEDKGSSAPYEASQSDNTRLTKTLDWQPETSIEDGITSIIKYETEAMALPEEGPVNVLITSVSKKVPLIQAVYSAAKKLSPNAKVFGGDMSSNCLGAHFVDEFWEMPPLAEMTVDAIVSFCYANAIRFIIPTRDGELEYFAERAVRFKEAGIFVMVSSASAIQVCDDKLKFYETLRHAQLPGIVTATTPEFETSRFVVKEATGAGSNSMGLNLTKVEAETHAKLLEKPLFQPFVKGKELSADVYITKSGKAKGVILRWREHVVNGESQITTTFANAKFESLITQVAQTLGIYGHAVLQAIVDSENNLHVVEANARFGGASPLSIAAGLDSFYWFFLECLGEPLDNYPFLPIENKKLVRYPQDKII